MDMLRFKGLGVSTSAILIPLVIFIAKELEIIFRFFGIEISSYSSNINNSFIPNFIEWFGVLYGMLLPLILVRAWQQLDDIDREFDKEADIVKILYEDLQYLINMGGKTENIGKEISKTLYSYVNHVTNNYQDEIKKTGSKQKDGDTILELLREQIKKLLRHKLMKDEAVGFIIREIYERVSEIADTRGDRISLVSQRLFESLNHIALITSIIFLIPFYFVGISSLPFIFDLILIISITFLVIYIYMIIEDFDQPFDGLKKISDESWKNLLIKMTLDQENSEKTNL